MRGISNYDEFAYYIGIRPPCNDAGHLGHGVNVCSMQCKTRHRRLQLAISESVEHLLDSIDICCQNLLLLHPEIDRSVQFLSA